MRFFLFLYNYLIMLLSFTEGTGHDSHDESKKKLGKRRGTQDPRKSGSDGVDSIISRMSSLRMSLVNKNLQQVSFMKNVALEETGSEVSEGGLSCDTDLLSLRHSKRCFKRH